MMEDDDIGEWFAKLTACLEDATSLAIEGQNPRLTLTERKVLLLKIQQQLTAVDHLTRQFGQPLFNNNSQE